MLSFFQSSLEDLSEVGVVNVREATGQAIEQSRKPIDCNAEEHSVVSQHPIRFAEGLLAVGAFRQMVYGAHQQYRVTGFVILF